MASATEEDRLISSTEVGVELSVEPRSWRRFVEPLILIMLGAFAVTQPVLSDFRAGAGYFVARRNEPVDIILLVVVLTLIPGLLANLVVWAADAFSEKARIIAHLFFLGLFVALISHTGLVRLTSVNWMVLMAVSVVIGAAAVLLYRRTAWFKTFLTYLIPAPLIFAIVFLVTPPVSGLVFPARAAAVEADIVSTAPVVFIVFDEFPVVSLLDRGGGIDAARYPNFAALSSMSTWYKYTAAAHDYTWWAVPALLTGQFPDTSRLPTTANYPANLITLFEDSHELNVMEPFTRLCPPDRCRDVQQTVRLGDRLQALASDTLMLYDMMLRPDPTKSSAISDPFNEFGRGASGLFEDGTADQASQFAAFLNRISSGPGLHFAHLLLPHGPFSYYPSGRQYNNGREVNGLESDVWVDPVLTEHAQQRHLLQVQAMDQLIGDLLAQLELVGILDDALIVVTADHGISFQSGVPSRGITDENAFEVGMVPLFIKEPGQDRGIVDINTARNIDVLPTVADHLGIDLSWNVDGQSLVQAPRDSRPLTVQARAGGEVSLGGVEPGLRAAISHVRSLFGTNRGVLDPYSIGGYDSIVGTPMDAASGASGLTTRVDEAWRFAHVAPDLGFVPGFLHGHLSGDLDESTHVAVGMNGVIRTVVPVFDVENDGAKFQAIVPDNAFLAGFNSLGFLALSGPPEEPRLETIEFDGAQRFALSRGANGDVTSLVDSSGTSWGVVEDRRIAGSVDEAFWNESDFAISSLKDLHVAGWAVDQEVVRPAERVVFFVNGVLAGSTSINRARNDIEDGYNNSEVRFSGFHGSFSQFLPVPSLEVRAFALSRGNAVELPITGEALAAIAAG